MALKTFVKVGSITNLTEARYCAGMGVDLLGFQTVEGQPCYVAPKAFQEIRGWVAGPQVVAEIYGVTSIDELNEIRTNYLPDYLEMGLKEFFILNGQIDLPFILTLLPDEQIPDFATPAYVIRSQQDQANYNGSLVSVATTLQAEAVLESSSSKGLVLLGSSEIKPGLKEYNELSEILEMLETDD